MLGLRAAVVHTHRANQLNGIGIPALVQTEIQESRSGDGNLGEVGVIQLHAGDQRLRDLARRHTQRTCALHGKRRSIVAVLAVLWNFYRDSRNIALRQGSLCDSGFIRRSDNLCCLLLCFLYHIHKRISLSFVLLSFTQDGRTDSSN